MATKLPVEVEAKFQTDGTMIPKAIIVDDHRFNIERAMNRGTQHPTEVPCISPTKYIVIMNGRIRSVYYEPSTMQWFAIKG